MTEAPTLRWDISDQAEWDRLLNRATLDLKAHGTKWLDLGGINAAAPGVARFKMGLGGKFFTLSGTYV